jgi:hypothetical protein
VAAVLVGCGDDDESGGGSGTATKPGGGVVTSGSFGKEGSNVAPEATLEGKTRDGEPQTESIQVASDDRVAITAEIENADERPRLRMVVPKGPSPEIAVQLGPLEGKAVSTLALQASAGDVRVGQIRYVCSLPPRTFCPVQTVENRDSYEPRKVAGEDGRIRLRLGLRPEKGGE